MNDTYLAQERAIESGDWDPEEQSWDEFVKDERDEDLMHWADL